MSVTDSRLRAVVVRAGRLYDHPSDGNPVRGLRLGEQVTVLGSFHDGAWAEVHTDEDDLTYFTKTYRLAVGSVDGDRLDNYYECGAWAHKVDDRSDVREVLEEEEEEVSSTGRSFIDGPAPVELDRSVLDPIVRRICYEEIEQTQTERDELNQKAKNLSQFLERRGDDFDDELSQMKQQIQQIQQIQQTASAAETELVAVGILDAGEMIGAPPDDVKRGWIEPGNGWLALYDRRCLHKERQKALRSIHDSTPISQARYALARTVVRHAAFVAVAYLGLQVALRLLG